MNILIDRETRIAGLGLTPEEAMSSMRFYVERSGKLSTERQRRRKEIHAWLPKPNLLHVKDVGAILYRGDTFTNLRTGKVVQVLRKPMAHYLCLYSAFDEKISFEDFTITIAPEVNEFLKNVYGSYLTLNDFPYIKPVETLSLKHYHATKIDGVSVIETTGQTIVVQDGDLMKEVEKVIGVSSDCLLAYIFASMGFVYDGHELRRIHGN